MNAAQELIDTYRSMIQHCIDALSPTATQEQRDKVRAALQKYLDGEKPSQD
jgi:hypothetical protein